MPVPGGDELRGGGDHQAVCPLQDVHGGSGSLLDAVPPEPFLYKHIGDHFAVRGGVEDAPPRLQIPAQLKGVGKVPVVSQGQIPFSVVHQKGLGVQPPVRAGGGVAHVSHGDIPQAQGLQLTGGKDLAHQAGVPVRAEDPVVVQGDPRTLLSPVLEGEEAAVGEVGQIPFLRGPDAEDPALLVELLTHGPRPPAAP